MRKVSEKCRRALSAILAAAMVLTSAPGTTMTAMAAEQTDAMETVVDSEEITVDDVASPDGEEKAALEGEGETGDEGSEAAPLTKPEFAVKPEGGQAKNREDASFTLSVPEGQNSLVKYVIGEANQAEAAVADPSASNGEEYTGEVSVPAPEGDAAATIVVKAIAIPTGDNAADYTNSEVATTTFTFAAKEETAAPNMPTFSFMNGETVVASGETVDFGTKVSMALTAADGVKIYYTLDGTDPTETSTEYNGAVELSSDNVKGETITVKAIAVADGKKSEVATATIVFAAKVETEAPSAPVILLKSGEDTLDDGAKVAFGTKVSMDFVTTEGTTVYYTKDGSDPTEESEKYNGTVTLSSEKVEGETVTVKAIAVKDGKSSKVTTASLTFEAKEKKTVTIKFNGNWKTFSCKFVQEDSDKSAEWKKGSILVNEGSVLHLKITAFDGFALKTVKLGDEEKEISDDNTVSDFTFTATEDNIVTVETVNNTLGYSVYDSEQNGLWPVKNGTCTYAVSPRSQYTIVAHEGVKDVVFEGATLNDSKDKLYEGTDSTVSLSEDKKTAVLSLGTEFAGQTCKVVLKHGEHNSTLTFNVAPVLTKVIVKDVRSNTLSQAMGETKSYALTLTPSKNKDEIKAECNTDNGVVDEIAIVDGKLSIKTAKKAGEAKITLYNKTTLDLMGDNEENRKKALLCEFTLNVVEPAWTKQKPKVKQTASTDTDVILDITAPKGVTVDDTFYYEISSEQTLSGNSIAGTSKVNYVKATDEVKRVRVERDDAYIGWTKKYTVKVRLCMTSDGNTPNGENVICYSETGNAVCNTKQPYYADKISLKKGTTTIYSGQSDIQVATIDFGKNTTYIDNAKVIVTEDPDAEKIKSEIRNGKVYVDVDKNTTPGKYTVKVTAEADETSGMKPAEATLTITVVAGISKITAVGSNDKIYLDTSKNGKGGKANVTVKYGDYNTTNKPKSAKFIYTLGKVVNGSFVADVAPLGTNSKNKGYVILDKKGNVTVDKTYAVKEAADDNTFAVEVKANDYKGNNESSYVEFTVVKEAQTLGKLVLLKDDMLVLDETVPSFTASALNGAQVAVLTGADVEPGEDGKYADADIVDSNLYTVSVKGKGITVDENGDITVTNPTAKKLTITATTKDGGKKSVALTIGKLDYDTVENVKVAWKYDGDEDDESIEGGKRTVLKAGEKNTLVSVDGHALHSGDAFELQIVYDGENGLNGINRFQNYTITVSGGAKVLYDCATKDSNLAKNQIVGVMLTDPAKDIKVTLKNGNKKTEYVLTATDAAKDELAAPQIKLDPKQTLVAGKQEEQELKFTVVKGDVPENAEFMLVGTDLKTQEFFGEAVKDITYADNKITVIFKKGMPEKVGSASAYFMLVSKDDQTPLSKLSKAVKITAVNMKKSFKLVTNYKMSVVDASSVAVAYQGTSVKDVTVKELYSENVKGKANSFSSMIGIGEDGKSLKLNWSTYGTKVSGYAKVEVTYDDDTTETIVSKITVTLPKQGMGVNTYKAAKVVIDSKTSAKSLTAIPVKVTAGKNEAKVVTVFNNEVKIKDSKTKSYIYAENITAAVNDGKLTLDVSQAVGEWMAKGKKVDLQVNVAYENNLQNTFTALNIPLEVKKTQSFARDVLATPDIVLSYEQGEEPKKVADNTETVTFTVANVDVYGEGESQIAEIYYTTDGTDPSYEYEFNDGNGSVKLGGTTAKYENNGVELTNPAGAAEGTMTIKAIAVPLLEQTALYLDSKAATKEVKWAAGTETPAEPTQLTAPTIKFSNDAPANREEGVTFTIETVTAEADAVAGVYYTTDGSEPALDSEGNPSDSTKKYENTAVAITTPNVDTEQAVTVKVLVVAKDQTTHKNATATASVTFAAKTTGGSETGDDSGN